MVKTILKYFGDIENSKKGTIRSAIALAIMAPLDIIWNFMRYKRIKWKHFFMVYIVTWFFLISSLGVANPDDLNDAVLYSFLVGLSIFSILHAWLYTFGIYGDYKQGLINWIINVGITIVAGVVMYVISAEKGYY